MQLKYKIFILTILLLVSQAGCKHTRPTGVDITPETQIETVAYSIQHNCEVIDETAAKTAQIGLKANLPEIVSNANTIRAVNADTLAQVQALPELTEYLSDRDEQIAELTEALEHERDSSIRQTRRVWLYISALASVGVAVSVLLAVLYKPAIGVPIGIACLILTTLATAMAVYAKLLALIALGVILIGLGLAGYELYKRRRVITELITSFDWVKTQTAWDDYEKTVVNAIQSKTTKATVKQEKQAKDKN